jgi:dTDP-4-amino-4,6-dideoxygalactose transaminase
MTDFPIVPLNDLRRHIAPVQPEIATAMARVLGSGHYILGEACASFEQVFAEYCEVAHCVGVANGTDALELALRAIGMGPNSRIATVANAGMYGTAAILAIGARPVFVDIDPATMTMSPSSLRAAGPVDAVIVTHLYGRMADMPALEQAAGGIPVVEDCAQAHGAVLDGRRAGKWGIAGCFSFYPTKNLGALGDGGAVTTDDAEVAARIRKLRQYGWTAKYHAGLAGGRNSRLDEIQAAALVALLPRLDEWNHRRRAVIGRYKEGCGDKVRWTPDAAAGADVAHLCVVRHGYRQELRAALEAQGIATDIHYPVPDYRQPAVIAVLGETPPLPETEAAIRDVLTLPCFPELEAGEIDRVISVMRGVNRAEGMNFAAPDRRDTGKLAGSTNNQHG